MEDILLKTKVKQNEYAARKARTVLKEASDDELKDLLGKANFPKYSIIRCIMDMHILYSIFEGTMFFKFFIPTGDNLSSLIVVYPVGENTNKSETKMIFLNWDVDHGEDIDIQD